VKHTGLLVILLTSFVVLLEQFVQCVAVSFCVFGWYGQ